MRQPLNGTITVTGKFAELAVPGTGLKDAKGVSRHIGTDLRARSPQDLIAPGNGVVTASYRSGSGLQVIELRIDKFLWRFLHLSARHVSVGTRVSEGQVIGKTGNSGGVAYHLHVDVRKDGTTWNQSLSNYVDYQSVINASQGISIQMNPGTWNVRTSPGGSIRTEGPAYGGQKYAATLVSGGWARITFVGKVGYVGPATFKRI